MRSFVTNNIDTIDALANGDLHQLEAITNYKFIDNTLFTVAPLIPGVSDYYLIHNGRIIRADDKNRINVCVSRQHYKDWEKKSMASIFPRCLADDNLQFQLSQLACRAFGSTQNKGKIGQHKFKLKKDRHGNKYYRLKYKYDKRYITGRIYNYHDDILFYTDYYTFITN